MMKITRTSQATGIERTMEIKVTQEQLNAWEDGTLIQDAMPELNEDEREFLISGMTPQEWEHIFERNQEEEYCYAEDDEELAF